MKRLLYVFVSASIFFVRVLTARAASVTIRDPLGGRGIVEIANAITDALVTIGFPIAAIMVVVGAIQIMTAAGSAEKISQGKKTITYAAVGYAIVVGWSFILDAVNEILQG
jgi:hypothetical protein